MAGERVRHRVLRALTFGEAAGRRARQGRTTSGGAYSGLLERCSGSTLNGKGTTMATDYDAPRLREGDEDKPETLEGLHQSGSRTVDLLEEGDPDGGLELPGADLSALSLEVQVLPRQADEFTCMRCYLVAHRSQESKPGVSICRDCA
jgi:Domain of unknown function (DUF4193)